MRADESLVEAGRKFLRFHCERMLAKEEGALEGKDIEALSGKRFRGVLAQAATTL